MCRLMSSIKSDDEIEDLLNHKNNSLHKLDVQVKIIGSGNHGNGGSKSHKTPDKNKDNHATLAVTAELIGVRKAGELFKTSESTVSNYKNGLNAIRDQDPELQQKIDEKLGKISNKIVDKVDILLDIFAEEKMGELKAGEVPSSVEKLVSTMDKINRRNERMNGDNGGFRPQVILYAPKQINISEYITKEV